MQTKQRGAAKLSRIPIQIITNAEAPLPKPDWLRIRLPQAAAFAKVTQIKAVLREHRLHTVCEEAACPNLAECFSQGTATFMIMGDKCTRRCSFCDVAHGRPDPLDAAEPENLATVIAQMQLRYVVITSVDRDDLLDGGASHFSACLKAIRAKNPHIKLEILVPDFRGRMQKALDALAIEPPEVFNHNLETIPRLYKTARPGSDYQWSLELLKNFKQRFPAIPTKSGLMLGLGETDAEIITVMQDLRAHQVDRLTLGQYLAPSPQHIRLQRFVSPQTFNDLAIIAKQLGFDHVASGPLVRSSYHADKQAAGEIVC